MIVPVDRRMKDRLQQIRNAVAVLEKLDLMDTGPGGLGSVPLEARLRDIAELLVYLAGRKLTDDGSERPPEPDTNPEETLAAAARKRLKGES